MKRLFSLAAMLLVMPLAALAQPSVRITDGPYLQAVGEREFTVVWRTNIDAVSWVEIAPNDGTHFYNTERRKIYQTQFGRRPIGTLHCVKVTGLEPATTYRYRIMQKAVLVNEGTKRVIFGEGYGSDILRHKPYEGSEKSSYTCKHCGKKFPSIMVMVGGTCPYHPNGANKGSHSSAL